MPQKNCKGQRQNRLFASVDFFDDQNCVPIAHRPSATIVLQSDGFLLPEFGYDHNSAFRPSAAFAHNFTVRDGILSALQTERRCRLLPAVFDIGLQRKFVPRDSSGFRPDNIQYLDCRSDGSCWDAQDTTRDFRPQDLLRQKRKMPRNFPLLPLRRSRP